MLLEHDVLFWSLPYYATSNGAVGGREVVFVCSKHIASQHFPCRFNMGLRPSNINFLTRPFVWGNLDNIIVAVSSHFYVARNFTHMHA